MLGRNFEYYNLKDNTKVDSGDLFRTTQSFILESRWKRIVISTM